MANNENIDEVPVKIFSRHSKGPMGIAARMYDILNEGYSRGEKPQTLAKGFKSLAKDFKKKQLPDGFIRLVNDVRKNDRTMFNYLTDIYKHLCIDKDWIEWGGVTDSLNLVFGVNPNSISSTSEPVKTSEGVSVKIDKDNSSDTEVTEDVAETPEKEKVELNEKVAEKLKRRAEVVNILRNAEKREESSDSVEDDDIDDEIDGISYEDGEPPRVHLIEKDDLNEDVDEKLSFKERMMKIKTGIKRKMDMTREYKQNIPWKWESMKIRSAANVMVSVAMTGHKFKQKHMEIKGKFAREAR